MIECSSNIEFRLFNLVFSFHGQNSELFRRSAELSFSFGCRGSWTCSTDCPFADGTRACAKRVRVENRIFVSCCSWTAVLAANKNRASGDCGWCVTCEIWRYCDDVSSTLAPCRRTGRITLRLRTLQFIMQLMKTLTGVFVPRSMQPLIGTRAKRLKLLVRNWENDF